jgi:hypothetical protein
LFLILGTKLSDGAQIPATLVNLVITVMAFGAQVYAWPFANEDANIAESMSLLSTLLVLILGLGTLANVSNFDDTSLTEDSMIPVLNQVIYACMFILMLAVSFILIRRLAGAYYNFKYRKAIKQASREGRHLSDTMRNMLHKSKIDTATAWASTKADTSDLEQMETVFRAALEFQKSINVHGNKSTQRKFNKRFEHFFPQQFRPAMYAWLTCAPQEQTDELERFMTELATMETEQLRLMPLCTYKLMGVQYRAEANAAKKMKIPSRGSVANPYSPTFRQSFVDKKQHEVEVSLLVTEQANRRFGKIIVRMRNFGRAALQVVLGLDEDGGLGNAARTTFFVLVCTVVYFVTLYCMVQYWVYSDACPPDATMQNENAVHCANEGGMCPCAGGDIRFGQLKRWSDWKQLGGSSVICARDTVAALQWSDPNHANFKPGNSSNSCQCYHPPTHRGLPWLLVLTTFYISVFGMLAYVALTALHRDVRADISLPVWLSALGGSAFGIVAAHLDSEWYWVFLWILVGAILVASSYVYLVKLGYCARLEELVQAELTELGSKPERRDGMLAQPLNLGSAHLGEEYR